MLRVIRNFLARFAVLGGAIPELWVVFGAKLFAFFAYTVMNQTLVLWLSSDLGYDDKGAGFVVTQWSVLLTVFTVLVGSFTDAIGLRKTFLLGVCLCFGARLLLTLTTSKNLALAGGLLPLAIGEALMGPVMVAAIQRFTTTAQRSISFSIFYAMMNVGIFLANLVFDYVRKGLGEHGMFAVPVIGVTLSTYRTLFLISTLLTVPNAILLYFFPAQRR